MDNGYLEEEEHVLRFADDDMAVEGGRARDLPFAAILDVSFAGAAGAGDDLDGGGHALDRGVAASTCLSNWSREVPRTMVGGRVFRTL